MAAEQPKTTGGRFDFDDGGTYCGGWEEDKAHGHGVCTGPKGQGEYSGAWHYGFEVSGVYTWPSGNTFEGQWQNGKRHGLGVERRGRWVYRGEWTLGFKGRYGVRLSAGSSARYEGTWANGLQDGYGTETYADGGIYQGQWLRGMRHGYGIRKSVPFALAAKLRSRSQAHASLTSLRSDQGDDPRDIPPDKDKTRSSEQVNTRGGFVLRAKSEPPASRKRSLSERSIMMKRTLLHGLRIKKQRSTGDIDSQKAVNPSMHHSHHHTPTPGPGSLRSSESVDSEESAFTGGSSLDPGAGLPLGECCDPATTETYMGEWKNDQRSGFGVSERSDGLKYVGEWFNNKKYGYGVTTLKDGAKEEGKYKNNVLVTSSRGKHVLFIRSSKLRERIDSAVGAAMRAAQFAVQKAEIAGTRTTTAKDRAEHSELAAMQAGEDSDIARLCAKQYAPEFHQPGTEILKRQRREGMNHSDYAAMPYRTGMTPSSTLTDGLASSSGASGPFQPRSRSLFIPKSQQLPNATLPPGGLRAGPHDDGRQGAYDESALRPYNPPGLPHRHQNFVSHDSAMTFKPIQSAIMDDQEMPFYDTRQDFNDPVDRMSASWAPGSSTASEEMNFVAQQPHRNPQAARQGFLQSRNTTISDRYLSARSQQPSAAEEVAQYYATHPSGPLADQAIEEENELDRYGSTPETSGRSPDYNRYPEDDYDSSQNRTISFLSPNDTYNYSPTSSQNSSRQSLIINDHFDQYSMIANPSHGRTPFGRQRSSPAINRKGGPPSAFQRTPTKAKQLPGGPLGTFELPAALIRRTTLATATDWKALALDKPSTSKLPPGADIPSTSGLSTAPRKTTPDGLHLANNISANHVPPSSNVSAASQTARRLSAASQSAEVQRRSILVKAELQREMEKMTAANVEPLGSLPDISVLAKENVIMTREEAARLSSQRREEIIRQREEDELLKHNPLRYLFHPAVKNWFNRRKLFLFIAAVNLSLSLLFYRLLTYSSSTGTSEDGALGENGDNAGYNES